jgi:hypothetical protein
VVIINSDEAMKTIKFLLVIVLLTTLFSSCESLIEMFFGKNEELTFIRTDYDGSQLRTDGYYYCRHEDRDVVYSIFFFYKNGVVLHGGAPSQDELITREEEFKNGQYLEYVKKSASAWGLFKVDSTTIQYEMLYYGPFRAFINSGDIINDTTFVITKRKASNSSEEITLDNTFHFKQFSPKPDSTNVYIK